MYANQTPKTQKAALNTGTLASRANPMALTANTQRVMMLTTASKLCEGF